MSLKYAASRGLAGYTIEKNLIPGAKVISLEDVPNAVRSSGEGTDFAGKAAIWARKQGYDVLDMSKGNEGEMRILNKEVLQTKSQLTDLYNKAQGGAESHLLQEAGKYKSAEEFVKAQGEPSYHGTSAKFDKFDPKKRGSAQGFDEPGVSFTTDKESAARYDLRFPRKPRYSWTDADKEAAKNANVVEAYFDKRNPLTFDELNNLYADGKIKTAPKSEVNGAGFVRPEQFIDNNRQAIKEASDITGKKVFKVTAEGQTNYMVTDESLIKTKSQLTDLYNKAQGGVAEAIEKIKDPLKPTGKERGFIESVKNSPEVSQDLASRVQGTYEPTTNKIGLEKAQRTIFKVV